MNSLSKTSPDSDSVKSEKSFVKASLKKLNFLSPSHAKLVPLESRIDEKVIEAALLKNGFINIVKIAFYDRIPTKLGDPESFSSYIEPDDIPLPSLDETSIVQFDGSADVLHHCRLWHQIRDLGLETCNVVYRILSMPSNVEVDSVLKELSAKAVACLVLIAVHCARNPSDVPSKEVLEEFSSQLNEISSIINSSKVSRKKVDKAILVLQSFYETTDAAQNQHKVTVQKKVEAEKARIMELEKTDEQITIDYGISSKDLNFDTVIKVFEKELKLRRYDGQPTKFQLEGYGLAHGVVYSANLPSSAEIVAVKMPEIHNNGYDENRLSKRALREARIWIRSQHPNVLPLLGYWPNFNPSNKNRDRTPLLPILVSPWCTDNTLVDYFQHSVDGYDDKERIKVIYEVSLGLQHLHSREPPIIHGDLRPPNVVIYQGRACIMDFSLSKMQEEKSGLTTQIHGEHIYQAPELRNRSTTRPTRFGDIYSFGCLFFKTISGMNVFDGIMPANNYAIPPRLPQVKNDLHWALMQWCWYFSAEARPTADNVVQIIKTFYDSMD